jgi:microcompartment protein CcmL/EutN
MADDHPALALVELGSLSRGYLVLDAVVKKAPVTVVAFEEVSPGKTLILFTGGESEVEESLNEARVVCGEHLLDLLLLPNVHGSVVAALRGQPRMRSVEALVAVETRTAAAAVRAADAAVKAADVELIRLKLCRGLGGKGLLLLTGLLHDVEAARVAAVEAATPENTLGVDVVSQPHPEIVGRFTS